MEQFNFLPLSLDDKATLDLYFGKENLEISEYTFTNLFVWQSNRKIEHCQTDGGMILRASDEKSGTYFLPPVGFENLSRIYSSLLSSEMPSRQKPVVKRVPKVHADILRNDSRFKIEEDRNNFDYVYESEKLCYLRGKNLDKKRAFVKKFRSSYHFHYLRFHAHMTKPLLKMAQSWINKSGGHDDPELIAEYKAIKCLMENFDLLERVQGAFICVEGIPAAFTFGEKLTDDTFVVHFEKANTDFIGSYQTINQLFVQNEICREFALVNREQDLGIEGLRKAKESYNPVKRVEKFNVSLS